MILLLRVVGVLFFIAMAAMLLGIIFCAIKAGGDYSYLDVFSCSVLLALLLWCATDEIHSLLGGG